MPIETCDLGKSHQPRLPGQCTGTHLSFHAGNKLAAAAVKPKDPPQPKDGKGMYIYTYIYTCTYIYIYTYQILSDSIIIKSICYLSTTLVKTNLPPVRGCLDLHEIYLCKCIETSWLQQNAWIHFQVPLAVASGITAAVLAFHL